jgi:small multidrug resistance pump
MKSFVNILYLIATILFEVAGTISLKFSQGFTRIIPSIAVVIFYALSFGVLSLTLKKLDVSFVYAVWSGMGTAIIAAIGILWFKEPFSLIKIGSIALIILGVVGLNLSGAH